MQGKVAFVLLLVIACQYGQAEAFWLGERTKKRLLQPTLNVALHAVLEHCL